jgi:hypothetical protein
VGLFLTCALLWYVALTYDIHRDRLMRSITALFAVPLFVVFPFVAAAQDSRELVKLPAPMQEHMLSNMRDHLVTLSEIIGDIAEEKFDQAAKLAEQRLGMSSLPAHDAAHMAPFMPKPMQDMGTNMHHAASQLVIVLQDASITPDAQSMRHVDQVIHTITSACTGCHAAYRIR